MALANLIPHLYDKIGTLAEKAGLKLFAHEGLPPIDWSKPYQCRGYEIDSHLLQILEKNIEDSKKFLTESQYQAALDNLKEVKNCLSDPANIISGGGSGEPNIGLYIAIGIGIATGMGSLAYYLKSRGKKSERASQ